METNITCSADYIGALEVMVHKLLEDQSVKELRIPASIFLSTPRESDAFGASQVDPLL